MKNIDEFAFVKFSGDARTSFRLFTYNHSSNPVHGIPFHTAWNGNRDRF